MCIAPGRIDDRGQKEQGDGHWRDRFLAALAETSNVVESAREAGVDKSLAYRIRRQDSNFASAWHAALDEGYLHLEMETLCRLRSGTGPDERKVDLANALRLLSLHRNRAEHQSAQRETRDEAAIFAAIDEQLDRIRARHENVSRLLREDGVSAVRIPGGNE